MLLTQTGTSSIFAVMLATVLAGIGIGGIIVSKINIRKFNLDKLLQYLLLAAAFSVVIGFYIYQLIFTYFFQDLSFSFAVFLLAAVILMLPTCIISGVLFPLFGEKLHHKDAETTQSSGILTLVNTLGAAVGSGVATFVLLPLLGVENSLFALVLAYLFCVLLVIDYSKKSEHFLKMLLLPGVATAVVVLIFPYGTLQKSYKIFGAERYPKEIQVKIKEGLNETLQYYRYDRFGLPHNFRLVTNNYSMSASGFYAERYMKLYAYFPYILHENIKDVLQISYGVGNTAEAITRLDTVERFDVVDISRDILELSSIIHKKTGRYPLKDKRTKVHIEDGRFYLQTTKRHFDLITGEPPPPKIAGVVNLYSQEYFNLVKDRLNPGGMVTYWLPVSELTDLDTVSIIKAFCLVFEDCSLWDGSGYDFMLVGSKNGIKKTSADRFRGVWTSQLANELESIGIEKPGQLGALFMADSVLLNKITEFAQPVTDNFPQRISTEFKGARERSKLIAYLLDINRRKSEFNNSSYISSIFPQELISESLPYFSIEGLIENITFHPRQHDNLNYWKSLSYLLSQTDMKTLPTLYLKSTPTEQKIVSQIEGSPPQEYLQEYQFAYIKQMLIKREFARASALLTKYIDAYAKNDNKVVLYKLYFLSRGLTGKLTLDEIKAIQNAGNFPAEEKFVSWITQQYLDGHQN
jgi:spermidine synthase